MDITNAHTNDCCTIRIAELTNEVKQLHQQLAELKEQCVKMEEQLKRFLLPRCDIIDQEVIDFCYG